MLTGCRMNRHELRAAEADRGESLLYILRRAYPAAPLWQLRKALKDRDILVDGRRVSSNLRLSGGESIVWYSGWAPEEVPVIYEDEKLLIINKPAGMNSDEQRDGPSAARWAAARAGEGEAPRLVHRLDNPTSGLLVFARDSVAEEALLLAFREGRVRKTYECLVLGRPSPAEDSLTAYMVKQPGEARVAVYDRPVPDGRQMRTDYRVIGEAAGGSRLLVWPRTGRTHQIRAQLSHIGHPILGDERYGDFAANRRLGVRRLMLCATGLEFQACGILSYLQGKRFQIKAPF